MFYPADMLARRGPLAKVWLASTMGAERLPRRAVELVSIDALCHELTRFETAGVYSLRLQAFLLCGIARLYGRKAALAYQMASDIAAGAPAGRHGMHHPATATMRVPDADSERRLMIDAAAAKPDIGCWATRRCQGTLRGLTLDADVNSIFGCWAHARDEVCSSAVAVDVFLALAHGNELLPAAGGPSPLLSSAGTAVAEDASTPHLRRQRTFRVADDRSITLDEPALRTATPTMPSSSSPTSPALPPPLSPLLSSDGASPGSAVSPAPRLPAGVVTTTSLPHSPVPPVPVVAAKSTTITATPLRPRGYKRMHHMADRIGCTEIEARKLRHMLRDTRDIVRPTRTVPPVRTASPAWPEVYAMALGRGHRVPPPCAPTTVEPLLRWGIFPLPLQHPNPLRSVYIHMLVQEPTTLADIRPTHTSPASATSPVSGTSTDRTQRAFGSASEPERTRALAATGMPAAPDDLATPGAFSAAVRSVSSGRSADTSPVSHAVAARPPPPRLSDAAGSSGGRATAGDTADAPWHDDMPAPASGTLPSRHRPRVLFPVERPAVAWRIYTDHLLQAAPPAPDDASFRACLATLTPVAPDDHRAVSRAAHAARLFTGVLALASRAQLAVHQPEPYGEIRLRRLATAT